MHIISRLLCKDFFADSKTMMWSSAYYLEVTLGLFLAEL